MRWLIILLVVLASSKAQAWKQGLDTTFHPGNWPGATILCLKSLDVSKGCSQGYNATCDGVADDTTAYTNFVTDAVAINGQVVLYIPPGSICNVTYGTPGVVTNGLGATPNKSIKNFVIWGYGVTMDLFIGPQAFPASSTSAKLIQTVSAGATSVTTVTASDAGAFSVGQWVCVCGLELQAGGAPPNFQFFEYRQVTSANASTGIVTFGPALANSYKSTWPAFGGTNDGPAALWPMDVSWDSNVTIYGITTVSSGSQAVMRSRTVSLINVTFTKTTAPSANQTFSATNSNLNSAEIDKDIETMVLTNTGGTQLQFQSPAPTNLTMSRGNWTSSLNGIPNNSTIVGTTFGPFNMAIGPSAYGAATSLQTDALGITGVQQPAMAIAAADVTYSSGTFTTLKTNPNINTTMARAVPGFKYCFNTGAIGPCNSSPKTTFTVTDVREDATHYFIDTDIVGSLPNVCGGGACSHYLLYSAKTITQTNKPAGAPDITVYAAP